MMIRMIRCMRMAMLVRMSVAVGMAVAVRTRVRVSMLTAIMSVTNSRRQECSCGNHEDDQTANNRREHATSLHDLSLSPLFPRFQFGDDHWIAFAKSPPGESAVPTAATSEFAQYFTPAACAEGSPDALVDVV